MLAHFVSLLALSVSADVRLDPKQKGVKDNIQFREPSTFGFKKLIDQKKNDHDQFLRSNLDNEANKRNAAKEAPLDMLPCRNDTKQPGMTLTRGVAVDLPLRWNNPHDSDCEVNVFVNGLKTVIPIKRPFNCGGGYQDMRTNFTIPTDFPGCEKASDNCVVQIYGHSVETRTYAMCIDVTLNPAVPAKQAVAKRQANGAVPTNGKDILVSVPQPAIHYQDSFDTSHVDSQFSGYRGQQKPFIRDQLAAVIEIRSFLGNGGLVPLGNVKQDARKKLENEVNNAIKQAERKAIDKNKAAQRALDAARKPGQPKTCFEGELYNVVNNPNCNRQFTNTYVTNVDYKAILAEFKPKFIAAGLESYTPKTKDVIGVTPVDTLGGFKVKNKPSQTPEGGKVLNQAFVDGEKALAAAQAPADAPAPQTTAKQLAPAKTDKPAYQVPTQTPVLNEPVVPVATQKPVEQPAPVVTPAPQAPVQQPVQVPQAPVQQPVVTPVQAPAQQPVVTPLSTPCTSAQAVPVATTALPTVAEIPTISIALPTEAPTQAPVITPLSTPCTSNLVVPTVAPVETPISTALPAAAVPTGLPVVSEALPAATQGAGGYGATGPILSGAQAQYAGSLVLIIAMMF
ncbi:hypothetical protein EDD86DRAFT_71353 [Gorgonomyces haynaldii]|nr:hypothetical protein EDD86DRAFT_71353 [Gorgonomyces haynaldii]